MIGVARSVEDKSPPLMISKTAYVGMRLNAPNMKFARTF